MAATGSHSPIAPTQQPTTHNRHVQRRRSAPLRKPRSARRSGLPQRRGRSSTCQCPSQTPPAHPRSGAPPKLHPSPPIIAGCGARRSTASRQTARQRRRSSTPRMHDLLPQYVVVWLLGASASATNNRTHHHRFAPRNPRSAIDARQPQRGRSTAWARRARWPAWRRCWRRR